MRTTRGRISSSGLPQSMGKDIQYLNPGTRGVREYAFYVRDNWQVTKKLTINYGRVMNTILIPTHDHYGASNYNPTTKRRIWEEKAGCLPMLI